jgi:bifunctional UDP-N-acetylglucosamine pyrophosphorylase/glucosamine-1-phosphate N-acetyltransferase/UDP-N-acetylglucosamine pyrophosphorylase
MRSVLAVVLAAGKGTRMKSELPKVLFPVLGRPMIHWVLDALEAGGVERVVVVVGYRAADVKAELTGRQGLTFVEQTEQLGTGHAVKMAEAEIRNHEGPVLVVTGDSPLIQAGTVQKLLAEFEENRPACLMGTIHKNNPTGLGRIVRDENQEFLAIVEEKDATPHQREITEVNMSSYVFEASDLAQTLGKLTNENHQREYYITDSPGILKAAGKQVTAWAVLEPCEALSINSVDELAVVEAEMQALGYANPSL